MLVKLSKLWPFIWIGVFLGAGAYYLSQGKWISFGTFLFFAVLWSVLVAAVSVRTRKGIHRRH